MNWDSDALIPRRALPLAHRRIAAARAVVVNGPRQSGKTELLRELHRTAGGTLVSLDDASFRAAALDDPGGFVSGYDVPLFIDEVQRGGDPLLLAVKARLDRSRAKGQVVMAGSTRFLSEPRLSESLAGRVRFVDLWPLAQGEIENTADGLVDAAFGGVERLLAVPAVAESRKQTMERVCRGGFPEAVLAKHPSERRDFFVDYVRTITARDVRLIRDIADLAGLRRVVRLSAAQTSGELSVADFARSADLAPDTCRRYLALLETVYLHHLVPAWSRNLTAKVRRRPKIHVTDTGVAAQLLGVGPDVLSKPGTAVAGHLLESFVAGELTRQLTWSDTDAALFHWSDRGGAEVDLVLEASDGRVVAIEVKAAVDINEADTRWLKKMRDKLGDQFVVGMVLHCGDQPRRLGDRVVAMPVSSLWADQTTETNP
ncbi:MAG: ATP-binding protein [Microthrixaceae bacterium]